MRAAPAQCRCRRSAARPMISISSTARWFSVLAFVSFAAVTAVRAAESESLRPDGWTIQPADAGMLELSVGTSNAFEQGDAAAAIVTLEYRFGTNLRHVGPAVGILVSADGGAFVYGGAYTDIRYGSFVVTPLLSVGAYQEGSGSDLGGTLQFRSSLTLAYELESGSRFGLRMAHISNAGLHSRNPGENQLFLTYDVRF